MILSHIRKRRTNIASWFILNVNCRNQQWYYGITKTSPYCFTSQKQAKKRPPGPLASHGAELQRLYALAEIRVALISHFTGLNVSLNPAPNEIAQAQGWRNFTFEHLMALMAFNFLISVHCSNWQVVESISAEVYWSE